MGPRLEIEFYNSVLDVGIPEIDKLLEDHHFLFDRDSDTCISPGVIKDEKEEDRISNLPTEIRQFIISLLAMNEGAATCILSKRWRNLWSYSAPRLDLNYSNLLGYEFSDDIVSVKEREFEKKAQAKARRKKMIRIRGIHISPLHFYRKALKFIDTQRAKFIRRVTRILKHRGASTLDILTVSFPLDSDSASHVDRWMNLAAAQGVTKLDLDLSWSGFYKLSPDYSKRYKFPIQEFGPSLKYLHLEFCALSFPPCFRGLNSLVSLHICDCFLTSNDVQNILSNCHSLEFLSLSSCSFPYPTFLKIVGPSIPLKHLFIKARQYIREIELHNVNLLSFEVYMAEGKLSIRNVPRLTRLVLNTEAPVEILADVARLETLFLHNWMTRLNAFNNLKRLVFSSPILYRSSLLRLVSLLKACHLLHQLELDMGNFCSYAHNLIEKSSEISTIPECHHYNLYEVVIYAFESRPNQIEFAKYLLKNAIALEKMKIYTTCKMYLRNGLWRLSKNGKLVGKALKEVCILLQKEARPSTELQFLTTEFH